MKREDFVSIYAKSIDRMMDAKAARLDLPESFRVAWGWLEKHAPQADTKEINLTRLEKGPAPWVADVNHSAIGHQPRGVRGASYPRRNRLVAGEVAPSSQAP